MRVRVVMSLVGLSNSLRSLAWADGWLHCCDGYNDTVEVAGGGLVGRVPARLTALLLKMPHGIVTRTMRLLGAAVELLAGFLVACMQLGVVRWSLMRKWCHRGMRMTCRSNRKSSVARRSGVTQWRNYRCERPAVRMRRYGWRWNVMTLLALKCTGAAGQPGTEADGRQCLARRQGIIKKSARNG